MGLIETPKKYEYVCDKCGDVFSNEDPSQHCAGGIPTGWGRMSLYCGEWMSGRSDVANHHFGAKTTNHPAIEKDLMLCISCIKKADLLIEGFTLRETEEC